MILRADLSAKPVEWPPPVRIPFGSSAFGLGLIQDVRHASLPALPVSFAVASDGSFWLVDEVKHRLAHFSSRGAYLAQIGGIRFDRFHPQAQDLVSIGDVLYLLEQDHQHLLLSRVREFRDGHQVALEQAEDERSPVVVGRLISGTPSLTGVTRGPAGDPARFGHARIAPALLAVVPPPNVHYLAGVPVDATMSVWAAEDPNRPEDRYLVTITGEGTAPSVRPIRVVVTPDGAERAPHLPGVVGLQVQAVLADRIAAWVQLTPSREPDARRYGGGTWLLEIPVDGSALVWERLPDPGISSERQVRSLAAGRDGTLYFMLAERSGMAIYRVPGP